MQRLMGVFLIVLSAVSFGTNPIFARICYAAGTDPYTFLFLRFSIASVVMVVFMAGRHFKYPRGRFLMALSLMGALGIVGTTLSYYVALTLAPVSLVVVIAYMYPMLVTLLAAVFFRQHITCSQVTALLLASLGIVLTIGMDTGGQFLGIALAVATAVIYAAYLVFGSSFLKKAGSFAASTVIIGSATIVFAVLVAVKGLQLPTLLSGWIAIVASALISTVFGLVCLFAGLKRIDAATTAMISTLEVVVSVALAILVLGETMTWPKITGVAMVICAVLILTRSEYKTAKAHIR